MIGLLIYKTEKKGVFLHGQRETEMGLYMASEPYIQLRPDSTVTVASVIRKTVSEKEDLLPDPQNWREVETELLRKLGLKSLKILHDIQTKLVVVGISENHFVFTPTYHNQPRSAGFLHRGLDESIILSIDASDEEIAVALEQAFEKCNDN